MSLITNNNSARYFITNSGTASPEGGKINITGGHGITTTGSGDTVTITSTDSVSWNEVVGTSETMEVDSGYIANNASLVTLTLPSSANVGDYIRVAGKGVGMWKIAQNNSQTIHFGVTDTTTGTSGYLQSTAQYDCVEMICIAQDTDFVVLSSVGNITIV